MINKARRRELVDADFIPEHELCFLELRERFCSFQNTKKHQVQKTR